jgi:F-type H+-transporting ATPase subunit b
MKLEPEHVHHILAQIAIFVVLWLVMKRFWFDPVGALLGERARRSEGALEEARAVRDEAETLRQQHARALEEVRAEAQRDMQEILRAADAEQRRVLSEAQAEAERILTEARGRIANEVATARESLRAEVGPLARQVAQAVIGRAV